MYFAASDTFSGLADLGRGISKLSCRDDKTTWPADPVLDALVLRELAAQVGLTNSESSASFDLDDVAEPLLTDLNELP